MAYVDIQCPAKALVDSGWPEDSNESTNTIPRVDDKEAKGDESSSSNSLKVIFRGKPRLRRPAQGATSAGDKRTARPRSSPTPLSSSASQSTTPILPTPTSDKSVTFKFREMLESEKPGLATLFPVTWQPGMKEYLIISDPEEDSDSDNNERGKETRTAEQTTKDANRKSSSNVKTEKTDSRSRVESCNHDNGGGGDPVLSNSDTEDESDMKEEANLNEAFVKNDRSLKSKLSVLTKDIGNLFSGPSHNLREFLRRREGYLPPEQASRLVRKKVEDHN